ncbi:UNKNOWN [Stylonychia lemnae]|uniref:Transmembrane protein n=1 Tax=Stylonychia lemnae TaxID=5949 RepID=A0A078ANF4_STYLE|nr:UNKNOWN [Stylonychia lemnae]|eukprot:CDW83441.1 UNKNOWN [Stylonychia lemnae]
MDNQFTFEYDFPIFQRIFVEVRNNYDNIYMQEIKGLNMTLNMTLSGDTLFNQKYIQLQRTNDFQRKLNLIISCFQLVSRSSQAKQTLYSQLLEQVVLLYRQVNSQDRDKYCLIDLQCIQMNFNLLQIAFQLINVVNPNDIRLNRDELLDIVAFALQNPQIIDVDVHQNIGYQIDKILELMGLNQTISLNKDQQAKFNLIKRRLIETKIHLSLPSQRIQIQYGLTEFKDNNHQIYLPYSNNKRILAQINLVNQSDNLPKAIYLVERILSLDFQDAKVKQKKIERMYKSKGNQILSSQTTDSFGGSEKKDEKKITLLGQLRIFTFLNNSFLSLFSYQHHVQLVLRSQSFFGIIFSYAAVTGIFFVLRSQANDFRIFNDENIDGFLIAIIAIILLHFPQNQIISYTYGLEQELKENQKAKQREISQDGKDSMKVLMKRKDENSFEATFIQEAKQRSHTDQKGIDTENPLKSRNKMHQKKRSSTTFDLKDVEQQKSGTLCISKEFEESMGLPHIQMNQDFKNHNVQTDNNNPITQYFKDDIHSISLNDMSSFSDRIPQLSSQKRYAQDQSLRFKDSGQKIEEQKQEEGSNNNSIIHEIDIKMEIDETIDKNENKKSTTANISSIKSKDHYLMKLENQQQISKKVRNQCFLLFLLNAAGLLAILIICAFMYPIDLFAFVLSLIFQALINLLVVLIIGTKIIRKWNSEVIDQNNPNTDKFGRFYLTAIRYQITYKKIMEIIKQS